MALLSQSKGRTPLRSGRLAFISTRCDASSGRTTRFPDGEGTDQHRKRGQPTMRGVRACLATGLSELALETVLEPRQVGRTPGGTGHLSSPDSVLLLTASNRWQPQIAYRLFTARAQHGLAGGFLIASIENRARTRTSGA
jgi:hypothetical protein